MLIALARSSCASPVGAGVPLLGVPIEPATAGPRFLPRGGAAPGDGAGAGPSTGAASAPASGAGAAFGDGAGPSTGPAAGAGAGAGPATSSLRVARLAS